MSVIERMTRLECADCHAVKRHETECRHAGAVKSEQCEWVEYVPAATMDEIDKAEAMKDPYVADAARTYRAYQGAVEAAKDAGVASMQAAFWRARAIELGADPDEWKRHDADTFGGQ